MSMPTKEATTKSAPSSPAPTQAPQNKLKDDNKKLKNLVKLAKARIEESDKTNKTLRERIRNLEESIDNNQSNKELKEEGPVPFPSPVRVVSRVRVEDEDGGGGEEEGRLFVLFEYRKRKNDEDDEEGIYEYFLEWKEFGKESEITDYIKTSQVSGQKSTCCVANF